MLSMILSTYHDLDLNQAWNAVSLSPIPDVITAFHLLYLYGFSFQTDDKVPDQISLSVSTIALIG